MDKPGIEHMVRQYYDRLSRAANFMCNDPGAAEDIVQETFAAAAASFDNFQGRSSRYTWLYGIFQNKFREWLRKKEKTKKLSLQSRADQLEVPNITELVVSDIKESSEILQQREKAEAVRKAIGELPPHHRDVIALRYIEGFSYEEISRTLDCSVGTVKSRMHYGLKKVGDKLKTYPGINSA